MFAHMEAKGTALEFFISHWDTISFSTSTKRRFLRCFVDHVFPARARRGAAAVVGPHPQCRNLRCLCSGWKSLQELKLATKLQVQGDMCAGKFAQNLLSWWRKITGVTHPVTFTDFETHFVPTRRLFSYTNYIQTLYIFNISIPYFWCMFWCITSSSGRSYVPLTQKSCAFTELFLWFIGCIIK
jgi:hypothetical protein